MGEGPGVPRHRHLWARLMGRASLGVRRNLWFPAKIAMHTHKSTLSRVHTLTHPAEAPGAGLLA